MGFCRASLGAAVIGLRLLFAALAAELPSDAPSSDASRAVPSEADCSNYPACAGLEEQCCPTGDGVHLYCCNTFDADNHITVVIPLEQQQIRYSPSVMQPQGVVRMPPSLPPTVSSCDVGPARLINEEIIHTTVRLPPTTLTPVIVPQATVSIPVAQPAAVPCPLGPPRLFEEGDCVLARGEIVYSDEQDQELTVSDGSLGTVVSVEPLGVMWRGRDELTNAEVQPEQIAFPELREGKILAIQRSTSPFKVLCLAAVRVKGAEGFFPASVKAVPCVRGNEDQVFLLMPCGTGNVRLGRNGDTCMELVHPELTLLRPCQAVEVDGQIFQMHVRSKTFQAGVNGFVGCYELGGRNTEELLLLPCNETSAEFSFVYKDAR